MDPFMDYLLEHDIDTLEDEIYQKAQTEGGEMPRKCFDARMKGEVKFINLFVKERNNGKPTGLDRVLASVLGGRPLPKNYRSLACKGFCSMMSHGEKGALPYSKDIVASLTRAFNFAFKVADTIVNDPIVLNLCISREDERLAHKAACRGLKDFDRSYRMITESIKDASDPQYILYPTQTLFLSAYDSVYRTAHEWLVVLFGRYYADQGRKHECAEKILSFKSTSGYLLGTKSDQREVRNSLAHPPCPPNSSDTAPVKVSRIAYDLNSDDLVKWNTCMLTKAVLGPLIVMLCLDLVAYGQVYGVYE